MAWASKIEYYWFWKLDAGIVRIKKNHWKKGNKHGKNRTKPWQKILFWSNLPRIKRFEFDFESFELSVKQDRLFKFCATLQILSLNNAKYRLYRIVKQTG